MEPHFRDGAPASQKSLRPIDVPANEPVPSSVARLSNVPATMPPVVTRSRTEPPAPAFGDCPTDVAELQRQLTWYRTKAIQLDNLVFEMRALLQSGKGFSEILNIDPLLAALMAVCRERYGSVNSTLLLLDDLDPENVFYRVRAYQGLADRYLDRAGVREEMMMFKIPHDQGLLWQLIHQGDVFSVRDMRRSPRFKTAFRRWNLEVLGSDVWVPLMRGGEVLGVMTLGECDDGSQIPEHEYAFLQEIASVAATNIDSTLKYEKNARILANLRTLYDINQQLANVNDFKTLTIDTLATAVRALHAQKANLMLLNTDTNLLEIKVVWGNIPKNVRDAINEGRMETKSFAIGEGVAGKAAQLRRPVRINDRTQIEQVGKNLVYCIMSVPLIYGGVVMGVMTLTNKVKENGDDLEFDPLGRFGEDDAQLLGGLADQAASNLHKARLYSASITDRLTGLFNARHFEGSFEAQVEQSRKAGTPLTVGITDIDHFKKFNDSYGHKAGDVVLASTARLLKSLAHQHGFDQVFRYGGEEFCVLLPASDGDAGARLLEEFRLAVQEHVVEYEGQPLRVTVSAGIATFPSDAVTRQDLFGCADRALYASKDGGRNRVTRALEGNLVKVD